MKDLNALQIFPTGSSYYQGQKWQLTGGFFCGTRYHDVFDWTYYSASIYILLPLFIKGLNYGLIVKRLIADIHKSRGLTEGGEKT